MISKKIKYDKYYSKEIKIIYLIFLAPSNIYISY